MGYQRWGLSYEQQLQASAVLCILEGNETTGFLMANAKQYPATVESWTRGSLGR